MKDSWPCQIPKDADITLDTRDLLLLYSSLAILLFMFFLT